MLTYDEPKRLANIDKHQIDLADCKAAFDAPMLTKEDHGKPTMNSVCKVCAG